MPPKTKQCKENGKPSRTGQKPSKKKLKVIQTKGKCQKCFSSKNLLKVQVVKTQLTTIWIGTRRTVFKSRIKRIQQVSGLIFSNKFRT